MDACLNNFKVPRPSGLHHRETKESVNNQD